MAERSLIASLDLDAEVVSLMQKMEDVGLDPILS